MHNALVIGFLHYVHPAQWMEKEGIWLGQNGLFQRGH